MVVTVCGIVALAVYVATRSDEEIKWSSTYILTLLMVMCIAMVWMVPLMVAAKNPDNILSIMYQVRQWIKESKWNICVPARSPWPWEPSSTADAQVGQGEKSGGGGGGTRRDFAWGYDDGNIQKADAQNSWKYIRRSTLNSFTFIETLYYKVEKITTKGFGRKFCISYEFN